MNGGLREDVHEIKEDVHTLKDSIQQLSNVISNLSKEVRGHSDRMREMAKIWERSIPVKLAMLLIIIEAMGILGVEAGRMLLKSFL